MREIDATYLKWQAMKLVEGTDLEWWSVVKARELRFVFKAPPNFTEKLEDYELAIGIVEGKPVWEGDELYYGANKTKATAGQGGHFTGWSWLPPKPKTAMVELLVKDIEYWSKLPCEWHEESARFFVACRKTLEQLK